jgi:hypothetical protein
VVIKQRGSRKVPANAAFERRASVTTAPIVWSLTLAAPAFRANLAARVPPRGLEMFERQGAITPPCGEPSVAWRKRPSSRTPAFSHSSIIRRITPSVTRWSRKSRSWECGQATLHAGGTKARVHDLPGQWEAAGRHSAQSDSQPRINRTRLARTRRLIGAIASFVAGRTADEPDLIFKRSTNLRHRVSSFLLGDTPHPQACSQPNTSPMIP